MQVITLTQASHSVVNFGNQPYFQFGRKDPMLAGIRNASGSTVDKGCYSDGYAFDKSGTGKVASAFPSSIRIYSTITAVHRSTIGAPRPIPIFGAATIR